MKDRYLILAHSSLRSEGVRRYWENGEEPTQVLRSAWQWLEWRARTYKPILKGEGDKEEKEKRLRPESTEATGGTEKWYAALTQSYFILVAIVLIN